MTQRKFIISLMFLQATEDIGVALITQVMHVRNKNSNIQGRSLNVI